MNETNKNMIYISDSIFDIAHTVYCMTEKITNNIWTYCQPRETVGVHDFAALVLAVISGLVVFSSAAIIATIVR